MLTRKDDGAEHCQVGNMALAVAHILGWLRFLAARDESAKHASER